MTMWRKIFTICAIAIALAAVPMHLVAQEREATSEARTPVLSWVSNIWSDFAIWLAQKVVPPPPTDPPTATTDGSCAVDPYGRCISGG
jgi:hypothetical protein